MHKIKLVEEINMNDQVKYLLNEGDLPKFWYNIAADLPSPLPAVLHPGTLQPIGPDDLAPLFPMSLIMQEVSTEREIEIPQPVRDIYRQWRPSPLYRARRLEKSPGYAGENLLQIRRRVARGQPQTQYRGAASVLQQRSRRE